MEAEIKFLDGLEVKEKLERTLEKRHNALINSQRSVIFQEMQEAYEIALKHGYKTFNFQVSLSSLHQMHLLPEIEQELKDSHWQVYFDEKRNDYIISTPSDEPKETPS